MSKRPTHGASVDRGLARSEVQDAERRSAPRAAVIFEAIRAEAGHELGRANSALFWSGLAAGLSMGFSFITEAMLQAGLPDTEWRPLISNLGYSIGFLIVILGRQQLFTENTLTPVVQVLREPRRAVLLNALRLWIVVLVANVIGTFLFGFGLYFADVFDANQSAALQSIAAQAFGRGAITTFLSAIFAGWLIALMVWLLPAAETARVSVIVIITYVVGISGFSHVIAGSTESWYAVAAGLATPYEGLVGFFMPTLFGNILGGVAFVAVLNYAQVWPDR